MNIVVTTLKQDYPGFIKLKTLKEAKAVVGTIDFLVYHKSNETKDEIVDLLTKLKDI